MRSTDSRVPRALREAPVRAFIAAAGAFLALGPGDAFAHGGSTVAEGQSGGVTVLVQGSDAAAGGAAGVDLATTLAGPGTGPAAKVVYYVRPEGRSGAVKVETERDESGVRHAEIPTANRGDWRGWDVSAVVTLSSGKRLRVTNAADDPPGPSLARATPAPQANEARPATAGAPTEIPPSTPADADVDDISGEAEAAPAWAIPSLVAFTVVGVIGLSIARRRRG